MRATFDPRRSDCETRSLREELADAPPRERLRTFTRHLVPLSGNEQGDEEHRRLMAWEVLAPTGAVEAVDE